MKTTLLLFVAVLLSACGKVPTNVSPENYWDEADRESRALLTTDVSAFEEGSEQASRVAFVD